MNATVALATCRSLPEHEADDRALVAALEARDVRVVEPVWDDESVDWSAHDACVIRTTWDYVERRDEFVAWARRAHLEAPLYNGPGVVDWNTHKGYLKELEAEGVLIAPSLWIERGSEASVAELVRGEGWERGFVKPCVGATASGTLRFANVDEDLARAQAHVDDWSASQDLILQPYLESVETEGELSAIFVLGELTHGVRKVPVAGDYRVQDDFGAVDEPYEFSGEELAVAKRAVAVAEERFGALLYARADYLRLPSGELALNELELVEPSLFLRHSPKAAETFAEGVLQLI